MIDRGAPTFSLSRLRQKYPMGSSIVQFSAPVYPKTGHSVIYYREFDQGGGFIYLVRVGKDWVFQAADGWTA